MVNEYIIQGAIWTTGIVVALAINRWASKKWKQEDEVEKQILLSVNSLDKTIDLLNGEIQQMKGMLTTSEANLNGRITAVENMGKLNSEGVKENRNNILKYVSKQSIKQ